MKTPWATTVDERLAEAASIQPERPLLRWGDEEYSYADGHRRVDRYAAALSLAGVEPGAHVSVMMDNGPDFLWTIWGISRAGAVAVPLNTAAKGELLRYFVEQSESSWLCCAPGHLDRLLAAIKGVRGIRGILVVGDASTAPPHPYGPPCVALDELLAASASHEVAPTGRAWNDPHLIMYTSGTTGPSKGVHSPHSQGLYVGHQVSTAFGYTAADTLYTCLPLFHGNALWYTVYAGLMAGACIAVSPKFSARAFWSEIRAARATQFNALGAMANIIWKLPPSSTDRDHLVRQCMMVPVLPALAEGFDERYGITVTSVYAMTENFAVTTFTPSDPPAKRGSTGRIGVHADVEIVDETGWPLPPGEVGEITIRPRDRGAMMAGYFRLADITTELTRDLWFRTGDRAYADDDGYLYFVDRTKESIRRRGENVSAYEVETIVCRHPSVAEAAAVPVASELSEDDVMVFLVATPGETIDFAELIRFCNDNMAYYMVPRYLAVVEELPKTASEKIEKYKLKEAAERDRERLWDREHMGIAVDR